MQRSFTTLGIVGALFSAGSTVPSTVPSTARFTARFTALFAAIFIAQSLILTSCNVSPRPEPPSVDSPPSLDAERIGLSFCEACDQKATVVEAGPGTVSDPDAVGWLVNLDRMDAPIIFDIRDDGSFSVMLTNALDGDELRIQLQSGDLRSDPVDFYLHATEPAGVELSSRALGDCLTLAPPTHLGLRAEEAASIVISNHCAESVEITRVALRLPALPYQLAGSQGPFTLPARSQVPVEVNATHPSAPDAILFVETNAPAYDRRPITLYTVDGS